MRAISTFLIYITLPLVLSACGGGGGGGGSSTVPLPDAAAPVPDIPVENPPEPSPDEPDDPQEPFPQPPISGDGGFFSPPSEQILIPDEFETPPVTNPPQTPVQPQPPSEPPPPGNDEQDEEDEEPQDENEEPQDENEEPQDENEEPQDENEEPQDENNEEPQDENEEPQDENEEPQDENEEPQLDGVFDGIVYTRQPRATDPVPGLPVADASNWQHVSDVGRINTWIAESDVVLDDLQGNQKVIYNCTAAQIICVAQEARVSPDGTKIAYSVGFGDRLAELQVNGVKIGLFDIPALTHARLFIYDIATDTSTPVPNFPANAIDRQPEWLDNDTLVFASNRANLYPHKTQFSQHRGLYADGRKRWQAGEYGVYQYYGYGNEGKAMQIWTMDIDGTNAKNLTPHETMALSPTVMTNGDIIYSCWNAHANEGYDAPYRSTDNAGTDVNKWWLCQMDGNGAEGNVILNGHKSPIMKSKLYLDPTVTGGESAATLKAVRSVAEIRKEYLAVTNYYRANHTGSMGAVYGWQYQEPGVEGVSRLNNFDNREFNNTREGSGRYIPGDFMPLTPYGTDQDIDVRRDGQGRAMGKAGYATPLPGTDDFMITHARGECYEVVPFWRTNLEWTGGEPLCQKGIYRVKTDMVTDPFDQSQMTLMAGGDQWQIYDADAVTNYQSLWGQPLPDRPAQLEGDRCFLQVVDARAAELQAPQPYDWNKTLYEQCSTQGCAVNSEDKQFHGDQMEYLTVYEVELWDKTFSEGNRYEFGNTINNHGFKSLRVWGFQELEDDGSVRMEVPCETPIQIHGQDDNNLTIAHDDKLHSLRKGETRTCHGCHDGHSEERAAQLGESAEVRFARTIAAGTNYGKPNNGFRYSWADIEPILENRCSSCHTDMRNNDGLLDSRIAWDHEQLDWPWMSRQPIGNGTFIMPRPYTSKWIGKFARQSLLFWKCMDGRQDGRTDRQYPGDIDFGSSHPTDATLSECLAIGHWIDQGVQRDPP